MPRTAIIKFYFTAACLIDVHNHLRQGGLGLETAVSTKKWWFRCFCTILGMVEVDVFLLFKRANQFTKAPTHPRFTQNIATMLLTNTYDGCGEPDEYHVRLRKRTLATIEEEEEVDEGDPDHTIVAVKEYVDMRKKEFKRLAELKLDDICARCKVCEKKPAPKCYYVCVECSDLTKGKFFGVCGLKSGRNCATKHVIATFT